MYIPSLIFERSLEEKTDPFKSWARSDQAFFAAGACHILADLFVQLHQKDGFKMVFIKPADGFSGNHVYASDGEWAFDHNGWTRENELIVAVEAAYKERFSGWNYEKLVIEQSITSLEEFCKTFNHRLPWQFAYLPWERAYNYIAKFQSRLERLDARDRLN
jgi:hypothetical protein